MIFLGLASNYSFSRILRHLFAWGTERDSEQLRIELGKLYKVSPANTALFRSGRSALTVAIKSVARSGSKVILPGLTCIAVVRAIRAAGCEPVFCDIEDTLGYNLKALKKLASGKDVSAIIVQNTLGYPDDIVAIEKIAQATDCAIIEDLAHSAGRVYADGRPCGTVGAAAALSFGKGKAIDTINGGAALVRGQKLSQPTKRPRLSDRLRDRWYPVFGGLARTFWRIGLGKLILAVAMKLHWIERSGDTELNTSIRLTHWQARLALRALSTLPTSPLREYHLVYNRAEVLENLKRYGYKFDEIWYSTPVGPARYLDEAEFPFDSCPRAVQIAASIVNLPTWIPLGKLAQAQKIIKIYEIEVKND